MSFRIEPAYVADAGEILTLQRAAFVSEAQLYGDPFIPPLVESAAQLRRSLGSATPAKSETAVALKAMDGRRLVGAVRGATSGRTCLVGRLIVAPDRQGRGLGTALMRALENSVDANVFDLFTGHLSEGNLRLYRRLGYEETRRERVHEHLTLVHLRKRV